MLCTLLTDPGRFKNSNYRGKWVVCNIIYNIIGTGVRGTLSATYWISERSQFTKKNTCLKLVCTSVLERAASVKKEGPP